MLNANSRVALQETEVGFGTEKCWAATAPPALQSRQQVEDREWDGGDDDPLCKGLHRSSTRLISSTGGEKSSKCREVDVDQARVPWGKTESGADEPLVPLSKVARAGPVTRRGSTQADGWTDSLPLSLCLPRKVGCQHLKAGVGNFSSYSMTRSFSSLAFSPLFNFTLNRRFSRTDRKSGTGTSAMKS